MNHSRRFRGKQSECTYVWNIPTEEQCEWVSNSEDCITDTVIQYSQLLFCFFKSDNKPLFNVGLVLYILWLLYLFLILGTTADNFFCPSLAVIASIMRLSDNIAGVTILAFGNGAPDLFTSFVSTSAEGIIMYTELLGAGVFVTSIIAGSIAVVKPFRISLKLLIRDVLFYIISMSWISVVVYDELVSIWEAFSFIVLYGAFIVIVILMQMYETHEKIQQSRIPNVTDPEVLRIYLMNTQRVSIPHISLRKRVFGLRTKLDVAIAAELKSEYGTDLSLVEEVEEVSTVTGRPKGLFREFLYDVNPISEDDWMSSNWALRTVLILRSPVMFILQLFIPIVDATAAKGGWSKLLNCFQMCVTPALTLFALNVYNVSWGPISIVVVFLVLGTASGILIFRITDEDRAPQFHNGFVILGFVGAMLMVYLIANEVVAVLQAIGYAFKISDAMLGITLLAWGNSVGDMIANVAMAKRGFPRMGYAACFGGPMFNTLLGLGVTYGKNACQHDGWVTQIRTSSMAPGAMAYLLASLLATLIYLNVTGAVARRSYGYTLFCIYISFMLVQFLSEFNVIHPLGTDHRPS